MNPEYAYHFAELKDIPNILEAGLICASKESISWLRRDFEKIYGRWPIFLAKPDCELWYLFNEETFSKREILRVDVSGFVKYPDLPTFQTEVVYERRIKASTRAWRAFEDITSFKVTIRHGAGVLIDTTKSFCILQDIPPSRIEAVW